MPMDRGSVMLPYLPAFCNSYLHHRGRRWHCLMAPPPPQVPSCFVRPQPPRMRDATTMARLSAEPPPVVARAPGLAAGPDTLVPPGCWPAWYPLCWPPPLVEALGLSQDAAAGDQRIWFAAKPPCTLRRNPLYLGESLVPWGEILVPWGEIPLTSWRRGLVPPGKSLVPWGETA